MNKPTLVVLAAGMGSRYGGLKQIDAFGPNGEAIIDYSIYDAIKAGFGKVVFIIRDTFRESFEEFLGDKLTSKIEVEFVYQELDMLPDGFSVPEGREKPWGTGHAVLVARNAVDGPFAVINADDFYGREAYFQIVEFFNRPDANEDYCVVGYYLRNTLSDHGTVNRGVCRVDENSNLIDINEVVKIGRDSDGVIRYPNEDGSKGELSEESVVSMNIFGFLPSYFDHAEKKFIAFLNERMHEPKSELYIPQVIDDLIAHDILNVRVIPSNSSWFGVTYREDKPFVQDQINTLIEAGEYPRELWG